MGEMQKRIDDYREFGVPNVWVLDPLARRAYVYSGSEIREVRDGMLHTSKPDIAVPLADLFDWPPANDR